MLRRRELFALPALSAAAQTVAGASAATAEVRQAGGKPTLFVRGCPVHASFYALTDCTGGRWSYDEAPRQSMKAFVEAGFRLFQLDLFLEDCLPKQGALDIEPARRQIAGSSALFDAETGEVLLGV